MMTNQRTNYGVDPGDRSLGVAAVFTDHDDIPLSVAALSLVLHDGGAAKKDSTGRATSRMAVRGDKRRTRRRFGRDKTRRDCLKKKLEEHGFPLDRDEALSEAVRGQLGDKVDHSCFPYFARVALLQKIPDVSLAHHLFAVAVRHIDRHRGWRNPWLRFQTIYDYAEAESLTDQGRMWMQAVGSALDTETPRTLGECAVFAIESGSGVKPTDYARRRALGEGKSGLDHAVRYTNRAKNAEDLVSLARWFALPVRPLQSDLLYELLLCAQTQGFDEAEIKTVLEEVFFQERPGLQTGDLVGKCPLEGGEKRAPAFFPAWQEVVVRAFVANLRVIRNSEVCSLHPSEAEILSTYLLGEPDRDKVSIKALEEVLLNTTGEIVRIKRGKDARATVDEEPIYGGRPPVDCSNAAAHKTKPAFKKWWKSASRAERDLFISALDSVTRTTKAESFVESLVADGKLQEEEIEEYHRSLPSGRAPYSVKAIEKILPLLREDDDLYTARQKAYCLAPDWQPVGAQWDEARMRHPVLQVARKQIAPILKALDLEVGKPDAVRIEVSRQTLRLNNPDFKIYKQKERETRNIAARQNAADLGLFGGGARRKLRIIDDQRQECAYQLACDGKSGLDPLSSEIDHIVPRSSGANNTRANLVATCTACNQMKKDRPFASFATESQLEAAKARVISWNLGAFDRKLEKQMIRRIETTELDEIDERTPTTTAQTAIELKGMIEDRYSRKGIDIEADSVMARLVGEARYSAGFNELLKGSRDQGKKKSRLDQRNHMLDAVVVACINNKVVPILERRAKLREYARLNAGSKREQNLKEKANTLGLEGDYFPRWLDGLKDIAKQLEPLLARDVKPQDIEACNSASEGPLDLDAVVPRRPIRLKAGAGALHKETAYPLKYKCLGDIWNDGELDAIADEAISAAMLRAANYKTKLPADQHRSIEVNGRTYQADDRVTLVTGKDRGGRVRPTSAAVAVRGASYSPGEHHHIRIYRYGEGQDLAFVPIYAFDVAQALEDARRANSQADRRSTYVRLRPECASFRSSENKAAKAVRKALVAGEPLRQVGWIAPGDELWLDELGVVRVPTQKTPLPPEWTEEKRWYCSGSEKKDLNVRPAVISSDLPVAPDGSKRKTPTMCRLSWAALAEHATLIRRDALGRPSYVKLIKDLGS